MIENSHGDTLFKCLSQYRHLNNYILYRVYLCRTGHFLRYLKKFRRLDVFVDFFHPLTRVQFKSRGEIYVLKKHVNRFIRCRNVNEMTRNFFFFQPEGQPLTPILRSSRLVDFSRSSLKVLNRASLKVFFSRVWRTSCSSLSFYHTFYNLIMQLSECLGACPTVFQLLYQRMFVYRLQF